MRNVQDHPPGHGPAGLLGRMTALSDAVFAIVLTLLVLDLRPPPGVTDANLFQGVAAMEPKLVAFATTFALVAVFWIAHVSLLRRLVAFDWTVAWVNLAYLFTIAITPFASTLLGEYSVFGNAWRLYCMVLIGIGAAQVALLLVIYRAKGRLVEPVGRREFWHRLIRAMSPSFVFALALGVSLLGFARISFLLSWILMPTVLILARTVLGQRTTAPSPPKTARPGIKTAPRARAIKPR
jgi:uncharacterized membrane protein